MTVEALRYRSLGLVVCMACSLLGLQSLQAQESPIRAKAVLHFSFDEATGDALDTAPAGTVKDAGKLINGASRVKSPFANQKDKLALIVDAARKQFVQTADGADIDAPTAVTLSFFYLHLGSPEDVAYHSLFAKRTEGTGSTNYGINFSAKSDVLQVYLNDGTGYKTAHYGVQQVLGFRRPNYITVSYEVGDATGDDADQDKDDILLRLYVNGVQQTPKALAGTQIVGNDAWLLNLNIAGLLNDVPLTIGSSTPTIEFASGLFDEFSIFNLALPPEEVKKLFLETAGANASTAILAETLPPQTPAPAISGLSANGLQLGVASTLVITGSNLQPTPTVSLPIPGAKLTLGPNTNANQVEVQITLPAQTLVGHYPIRVQTPGGVSNSLPIAVDGLPEVAVSASSPEKPLTLPVAVSGVISGAQQVRTYFQGQAGQRVIADIEARRIGAAMTPVIEIKSVRGTPLKIEWGHIEYSGDARADVVLPANGLYYVEIHDLSYAAPGVNPFRLKIGDLKLADVALGGVTEGTEAQLALSGTGTDPAAKLPVNLKDQPGTAARNWLLPPTLGIAAPAPKLIVGSGPEFVETHPAAGQIQTIEAKFATPPLVPVGFTGVLGQRGERDVILVQVTPGQKLNLSVSGAAVNSPLDPQIQILKHPEGNVLAAAENPGTREATLEYTVAADQPQIQVAIRDLRARGGANFRYRLRIAPAGQTDFNLTLSADRIQLPQDGSVALQLDVSRAGYTGPIKLSVQGDPQVTVQPAEIPANFNKAWITLTRQGAAAAPGTYDGLRIVGEAVGVDPPLSRLATVPADPRLNLLPNDRATLSAGLTAPVGATLELGALPPAIFKGADIVLPVKLKLGAQPLTKVARLTLLTTEAARRINPNDPSKGEFPRVDSGLNQTIDANDPQAALKISVPTDIAEPNIDFVIKAELVEHGFSQNVAATIYSAPFRLPVQNAVTVTLAANNLMAKGGVASKLTGTIKRTTGFQGAISVQILNLPAGATAPAVTIPPDQETFEITVTPAAVAAVADVPNVVFRAAAVDGGKPVQADVPLATKISP